MCNFCQFYAASICVNMHVYEITWDKVQYEYYHTYFEEVIEINLYRILCIDSLFIGLKLYKVLSLCVFSSNQFYAKTFL